MQSSWWVWMEMMRGQMAHSGWTHLMCLDISSGVTHKQSSEKTGLSGHRARRTNSVFDLQRDGKLTEISRTGEWGSRLFRQSLGHGGGGGYQKEGFGGVPLLPTWGGSVPIQQVFILGGVEVHDDAGSIQQLLVAAGAGDAVVAVPAVASVVQLLRLHLATRRCPGW